MMSLAGVPPLSGFFGKFQLFAAVIQRAQTDPHYYVLAAIGAAAVVISLYFYLGIGRAIYMQEAEDVKNGFAEITCKCLLPKRK